MEKCDVLLSLFKSPSHTQIIQLYSKIENKRLHLTKSLNILKQSIKNTELLSLLSLQPFVGVGLLYKLSPAIPCLNFGFPVKYTQVPQILLHTIHPSIHLSHSSFLIYFSAFFLPVLQALLFL